MRGLPIGTGNYGILTSHRVGHSRDAAIRVPVGCSVCGIYQGAFRCAAVRADEGD
jgi:hypothetical protein